MFWQKKKVTIFVTRSAIQVSFPNIESPSVASFPITLVHNLELIDQIEFEKYLDRFFQQNKISHFICTVILDESFLFWKKYSTEQLPESDFFTLIPLPPDQLITKTVTINSDVFSVGYNISILSSIQRVLHNTHNKVSSLIPFFAFPGFESEQILTIHVDEKSIHKSYHFDSDILSYPSSPSPLIWVISFILFLCGIFLYGRFLFLQPNTVVVPILPEITYLPSPSPTINYLNPKDVIIDIYNGSEKFGEAGRLKSTFEEKDWTVGTINNAESSKTKTEIAAKITVPGSFLFSIQEILEKKYQVDPAIAILPESTSSADIVITIGTLSAQLQ